MLAKVIVKLREAGLFLGLLLTFSVLENLLRPTIGIIVSSYIDSPTAAPRCLSGRQTLEAFLKADRQDPDRIPMERTEEAIFLSESENRDQLFLSSYAHPEQPRPIEEPFRFSGYRFWNNTLSSQYTVVISSRRYNKKDLQVVVDISYSLPFSARMNARKEILQLHSMADLVKRSTAPCPKELWSGDSND